MLRLMIFQTWDYEVEDDMTFLRPWCYRSGDYVEVKLTRDISLRSRAFRDALFSLLEKRPDVTFVIRASNRCKFHMPGNVRVICTVEKIYGKYRVLQKARP